MAAPTARAIVTGRRLKISSFTGTKFVYEKYTSSFRNSPGHGISPLANRPYCTYNGWSSPKASRTAAMFSGVVAPGGPAGRVAGGSFTKMMNVIRDTMNSTKIRNNVRRIRYLPIAPPRLPTRGEGRRAAPLTALLPRLLSFRPLHRASGRSRTGRTPPPPANWSNLYSRFAADDVDVVVEHGARDDLLHQRLSTSAQHWNRSSPGSCPL